MGSNCPLQKAHPFGGKLNETILTSPKYGSLIESPPSCPSLSSLVSTHRCAAYLSANPLAIDAGLRLTREDAEQRQNEIDHKERNHIVVRLATTCCSQRAWVHKVGRRR